MTDKQKQVMGRIATIIPRMTDQQGEQFLAYGEGMVSMIWQLAPPSAARAQAGEKEGSSAGQVSA